MIIEYSPAHEMIFPATVEIPEVKIPISAEKRERASGRGCRADYRRHAWITTEEAADLVGCSVSHIYGLVCRGRITGRRCGRYRIDQASLHAYMDGRS